MNKKLIIITLLLVYCNISFSQVKDTIYYDIYWENTTKEKASFFRPFPLKKEQGFYLVKDYFIEGALQMEGRSNDIEGDVFEGKVTWYYKNGNIETERTYSNGIIEGEVNSYFPNGVLMSSGIFKNNEAYSGNFYAGTVSDRVYTYVDGVIVSESNYYEDTKTIAQKIYYENNSSKGKTIFFNKKGDLIATKYNDDSENKTDSKVLEVFFKLTRDDNFDDIFFILSKVEHNGELQHILKDNNHNIVGQGTIKNKKPYTGTFFSDYQILEYKEGIKDGEVIFYNKEYQKTGIGIYKNGEKFSGEFYDYRDDEKEVFENGKIIAKRTKNKHTSEEYYCEFQDDTPTNGDYFTNRKVETFKNKKLVKSIDLDFYTGLKKKTTFYGKDKYETTKEIYHKDGEEYILTYKDGRPFEGKNGSEKGYVTYTNGEVTGPFLREEYRQAIINGNYKDYKKEGEISYIIYNTKDTVTCLFKEDKPITGSIFENSQLTSYKNGKEDGCGYKIFDYKGYVYDSIQMCYKGGVPSGTKKYYKENKFVTQLTYKGGKPFNGTSYIKKYKTVYKDGKKIKNELSISKELYKQQFFNIDNQPTKEVIKKDDYTDSTLYTITYKKGKPYLGVEIAYDSINEIYKKTNYVKGEKEGVQSVYQYLDKHFIAQYNYKNNVKEGLARFKINPFTETIYDIEYKKGKPYTGTLVENDNDNKYKKTYYKGELQSITYYQYSRDEEFTSVNFKKGKPYNGFIIKDNGYDKDVKEYSEGDLVTTFIEASSFNDSKPTTYKTKIYHSPLKDSVVNIYRKGYSINIIYDSKAKKSGEVYYYLDTIQKGYGRFKNKKIIEFKYNEGYENYNATMYLLNNSIVYEFTFQEFLGKYKTKGNIINKPYYQFFTEKIEHNIKHTNQMQFYIDNYDTPPLTTVEIKDGEPYNGIIFSTSGMSFDIRVYEKGEIVKEFKQLTKQEVIDKIKELTSK